MNEQKDRQTDSPSTTLSVDEGIELLKIFTTNKYVNKLKYILLGKIRQVTDA